MKRWSTSPSPTPTNLWRNIPRLCRNKLFFLAGNIIYSIASAFYADHHGGLGYSPTATTSCQLYLILDS